MKVRDLLERLHGYDLDDIVVLQLDDDLDTFTPVSSVGHLYLQKVARPDGRFDEVASGVGADFNKAVLLT